MLVKEISTNNSRAIEPGKSARRHLGRGLPSLSHSVAATLSPLTELTARDLAAAVRPAGSLSALCSVTTCASR